MVPGTLVIQAELLGLVRKNNHLQEGEKVNEDLVPPPASPPDLPREPTSQRCSQPQQQRYQSIRLEFLVRPCLVHTTRAADGVAESLIYSNVRIWLWNRV